MARKYAYPSDINLLSRKEAQSPLRSATVPLAFVALVTVVLLAAWLGMLHQKETLLLQIHTLAASYAEDESRPGLEEKEAYYTRLQEENEQSLLRASLAELTPRALDCAPAGLTVTELRANEDGLQITGLAPRAAVLLDYMTALEEALGLVPRLRRVTEQAGGQVFVLDVALWGADGEGEVDAWN